MAQLVNVSISTTEVITPARVLQNVTVHSGVSLPVANLSSRITDVKAPYKLFFTDDRDVKPTNTTPGYLAFYFTTLEGMQGAAGSDYQDLLVLSGYTDQSGGNVNALLFEKNSMLIRHYQSALSGLSWGSPKILAYTDTDHEGLSGLLGGATDDHYHLTAAEYQAFSGVGFSGISGWSGLSGVSGWSGDSGWSGWSGEKGDQGDSGFSGISGWSGDSGWSGLSGWSGWTGWSGKSGQSGTSGWSGDSGWSGLSGWSGWSGQKGDTGDTGATGTSGFSGWSGWSGLTGASGWSGQKGDQGDPGATGTSGWSGQSGLSGWSGWTGWSGKSGISGPSGLSGWSGPSGLSGWSGWTGWSGKSGISGPSGLSGWSGQKGNTGNTGATGDSGFSGWSGQKGDQGNAGADGASGLSGWSGQHGDIGNTGPSGPSGPSGLSGWSGWSGKSGPSGPSGLSGWSGWSGWSGKSGISGPSGLSGWSGWTGWSGKSGISGPSGWSGLTGASGWSGLTGWSGRAGTTQLSGITIDADRYWNEKSISGIGNLAMSGALTLVGNSTITSDTGADIIAFPNGYRELLNTAIAGAQIVEDSNNRLVTDAEKSTWNGKPDNLTELTIDNNKDWNAKNITNLNNVYVNGVVQGGGKANFNQIEMAQASTGGAISGGAIISRGDRATLGGCCIQLGGSGTSKLEVIDQGWTKVLTSVDDDGHMVIAGYLDCQFNRMFRAYKVGGNQSYTAGNWTVPANYSENYDTHDKFLNGDFYCPVAGLYLFECQIAFYSTTTGAIMDMELNSSIGGGVSRERRYCTADNIVRITTIVSCAYDEVFRMKMYCNYGGTILEGNDKTFICAYLLTRYA